MSYNGIGLSTVRGTATSGYVQANKGHIRAARLRRQRDHNTLQQSKQRYSIVSASARERGNRELQEHERKRKLENDLLLMREELEEDESRTEDEIDELIDAERARQMAIWKEREERANQIVQGPPQKVSAPNHQEEGGAEEEGQIQDEGDLKESYAPSQGPTNAPPPPPKARQYGDSRQPSISNAGRWDRDRGYTEQRGWGEARREGSSWQYDRRYRSNTTNTHTVAERKEEENYRLRNAFGIRAGEHREGAAFDRELQAKKKAEQKAKREEEQKLLERQERERLKRLAKERKASEKKEKVDTNGNKQKKKASRRRRSPSSSSTSSSDDSSRSSSSYSSDDSSRSYSSRSSSDSSYSRRRRRGRRRRRQESRRRRRSPSYSSRSSYSSRDSDSPEEGRDRKRVKRTEDSRKSSADDENRPDDSGPSRESQEGQRTERLGTKLSPSDEKTSRKRRSRSRSSSRSFSSSSRSSEIRATRKETRSRETETRSRNGNSRRRRHSGRSKNSRTREGSDSSSRSRSK